MKRDYCHRWLRIMHALFASVASVLLTWRSTYGNHRTLWWTRSRSDYTICRLFISHRIALVLMMRKVGIREFTGDASGILKKGKEKKNKAGSCRTIRKQSLMRSVELGNHTRPENQALRHPGRWYRNHHSSHIVAFSSSYRVGYRHVFELLLTALL